MWSRDVSCLVVMECGHHRQTLLCAAPILACPGCHDNCPRFVRCMTKRGSRVPVPDFFALSRLADSILGFNFSFLVSGTRPKGPPWMFRILPHRREGARMRLPMPLSDIVLVFCLAAFIAGLMMIAAASLLS